MNLVIENRVQLLFLRTLAKDSFYEIFHNIKFIKKEHKQKS